MRKLVLKKAMLKQNEDSYDMNIEIYFWFEPDKCNSKPWRRLNNFNILKALKYVLLLGYSTSTLHVIIIVTYIGKIRKKDPNLYTEIPMKLWDMNTTFKQSRCIDFILIVFIEWWKTKSYKISFLNLKFAKCHGKQNLEKKSVFKF